MRGFNVIGLAIIAAGCAAAPSISRGQVLMKIDGTEAHVRLPENTASVGDRVQFLRRQCSGAGKLKRCRDEPTGEGQIVQLLNSRYSVVRVRCGVPFDEGDAVEKVNARSTRHIDSRQDRTFAPDGEDPFGKFAARASQPFRPPSERRAP